MKTIIYTCNNDSCGLKTNDIEATKWIEIGSENNTLFVNNFLKNKAVISFERFETIHFCSSQCMAQFFFK